MKRYLLLIFTLLNAFNYARGQVPDDSTASEHMDSADLKVDSLLLPKEQMKAASPIENLTTEKVNDNKSCFYHIKPVIDFPVTLIGVVGTPLGFYLVNKKPSTDTNVILNLNPDKDIEIGINRKDIHNYDPNLKQISDYFLYGSFAYGFILLFDQDIRQDAAKIGLLYLETMSITGASYSLTAASVNKLRPYSYDTDSMIIDGVKVPEVPMSVRASTHARNSFYGGHPSAPAAATLFVASVYSVYHPHSPLRFALYGVAVAATGTTAYLRYKGGYHFPTDLAIGVALGTTYGLLIPRLHRCEDGSGLTVTPLTGQVKGLNFTYTF